MIRAEDALGKIGGKVMSPRALSHANELDMRQEAQAIQIQNKKVADNWALAREKWQDADLAKLGLVGIIGWMIFK